MSRTIKATLEEEKTQQAEFSIDFSLPEDPKHSQLNDPPSIDVAMWPHTDSDFHYSASISLEEALNSYIDDNIIPDGTTRQEYKDNLEYGLNKLQTIIDEAKKRILTLPIREFDNSSSSKPKP